MKRILFVFTINLIILSTTASHCIPRKFSSDSVVCICNSTYCDFLDVPDYLESGKYIHYVSDRSGRRFSQEIGIIEDVYSNEVRIEVDTSKKYQKIIGFGGAFTDAAGYNVQALSKKCQENLMRSYFDSAGIKYTLGRVPIAGTDFSTRPYTYDDHPEDLNLAKFNLTSEDYIYKIPFIKKAKQYNPDLQLLSAAWSAPKWMKSNNHISGIGWLKSEYFQTYADYVVKFLEEYKKEGLEIWAVSTGNEPTNPLTFLVKFNSMFWFPSRIAQWVDHYLYPTIRKSSSNNTKIIALDDQRYNLPWYFDLMKSFDNSIMDKFDIIGVHWYSDTFIPVSVLDSTHRIFPKIPILMTEACIASLPGEYPRVILGSWSRAEDLAKMMFQNLNHWVAGWVDWNLALDIEGGPNWVDNKVDSPIIVIPNEDIFYKQPLFYIHGHFSKFVPVGSYKVESASADGKIWNIAFVTPQNRRVVVLYNEYEDWKNVSILDKTVGNLNIQISPKSTHTILY